MASAQAATQCFLACLFTVALRPAAAVIPTELSLSEWEGKRILFITAHPDDAEGFAGGTIAQLNRLNATIAYLVVTTGDAGGDCYDTSTGKYQPKTYICEAEEIAFLRRQEMKAAGKFLGVQHVWRAGFGDGMLISVHESTVRERISAYIRSFRPHVVFTHAPEPDYGAAPTCNGACPASPSLPNWAHNWDDLGYHPDHQRVGWHVLNAVYTGGSSADNDRLFRELAEAAGLHSWKVPQLYFFALTAGQGSGQASLTHYVALTEAELKVKADACAYHRSQYHGPPLEGIKWVGARVATAANLSPGAWAEGFRAFF